MPKARIKPTLAKFQGRYRVTVDGCWEWTRYVDKRSGYGRWDHLWAHRVSYTLHVGPIQPGMAIDHLCRNKVCVNPAHLEAVSPGTNFMRSMHRSAVTHATDICKRGHELTPENTYLRPDGSGIRQCRACIRLRNSRAWQEANRKSRTPVAAGWGRSA